MCGTKRGVNQCIIKLKCDNGIKIKSNNQSHKHTHNMRFIVEPNVWETTCANGLIKLPSKFNRKKNWSYNIFVATKPNFSSTDPYH